MPSPPQRLCIELGPLSAAPPYACPHTSLPSALTSLSLCCFSTATCSILHGLGVFHLKPLTGFVNVPGNSGLFMLRHFLYLLAARTVLRARTFFERNAGCCGANWRAYARLLTGHTTFRYHPPTFSCAFNTHPVRLYAEGLRDVITSSQPFTIYLVGSGGRFEPQLLGGTGSVAHTTLRVHCGQFALNNHRTQHRQQAVDGLRRRTHALPRPHRHAGTRRDIISRDSP